MTPSHCLNCSEPYEAGNQFCPACGQTTHTHRLTLGHFLHEAWHATTHTDKGIFHLLKRLATRPGTTAREYLEGRRKAYFNPFTFFLLAMAVFVFLNVYFAPPPKKTEPDRQVLSKIPSVAGKQNYISRLQRVDHVAHFTRTKGNILAMIAIPYISLFTWLFFRKREFNYAEHLTANMMFITFSNLLFAALVFPLQAAVRGTRAEGIMMWIGMMVQVLYLGWCLNGLFQLKSLARLKAFGVSLLAILLWVLLNLLVIGLYIYQSL